MISTKSDVRNWETVATYVATYPSDDVAGACDVSVEIGEAGGLWYLRTTDDAGGSDDCDDTSYETREAAAEAAEAFAAANDEAPDDDDATAYVARLRDELARLRDEAIGETDPDGEYCVYWSTALEDSGPRERYATAEQAVAAAEKADEELRQKHWRNLLCGFEARVLADGEWAQLDAVRD